jgi:hypothetical protein
MAANKRDRAHTAAHAGARAAYTPLRALAVNVIAIHSHSRRKADSTTLRDPPVELLYSLDELTELRRNVLRCARRFPPGHERNQHLQVAAAFARRSSVKNGCGITFGTSPDDHDLGISQLAWARDSSRVG